ncbi:MAG: hypothetical protein N2318_10045 [Meiothermus sp.]|nr:hypothetical protein [Meiothermus sp.]
MRTVAIAMWLGLLAGCTNTPLTVALQDFDVPIATIQSGQAVFTKQNFNRPPVSFTAVALEGNLTYQQGSISLGFYTSDVEPCAPTGGVYICNPANPSIQAAGSANFQSGATQPLRLAGSKLTSGINSGNLWIGVKLESGIATAGTLQFRNMVAKVALLP